MQTQPSDPMSYAEVTAWLEALRAQVIAARRAGQADVVVNAAMLHALLDAHDTMYDALDNEVRNSDGLLPEALSAAEEGLVECLSGRAVPLPYPMIA